MTIDEMIAVLQAAKEGKTIQARRISDLPCLPWQTTDKPQWDFGSTEYRIVPEPRDIWLYEYPGGILGYHYTFKELKEVAEPQRSRMRHFREVIE